MKKFKDPTEYALSKENIERTRKDIRARFYRERWFFGAMIAAIVSGWLYLKLSGQL